MTLLRRLGIAADTPAKPESALETIIARAEAFQKQNRKKGTRNLAVYYFVGAIGILAGILASTGNSLSHLMTIVVGLVAAAAVAIQTFLKRLEKSRYQYDNAADAGAVALEGRILADRAEPPTEDELLDLVERLTEILHRPFEYTPPKG